MPQKMIIPQKSLSEIILYNLHESEWYKVYEYHLYILIFSFFMEMAGVCH